MTKNEYFFELRMPDRSFSQSVPLIAGFTGGSVSTTLLFPLDIVKVRLQVTECPVKRQRPLRALRIFGGILKYEGVRGLYSGWTPAVIGSAVSWGGYFFLYEGFKKRLAQYKVDQDPLRKGELISSLLTPSDNFALACGSGAVMVLLTNPIWLVKTRMQLQMRKASERHNVKLYSGMIDAFRTIPKEEGFMALYKGSGPAFLLTSHGGVQFVVYEFLRKHFHYRRANREDASSVWRRLELSSGYLAMGATAKFVASTTTYPLQVVKARMQQRSQSIEITADGEVQKVERKFRGLIGTVKNMWRAEGVRGFFNGVLPNSLRVAPGAAITFVVYETVVEELSDR